MIQQFKVLVTIEGSRGTSHIIIALNKAHAELIVRNHYELNKLPYEFIVVVEVE